MRRPKSTPAQRQHAREQRALLRLRKAAVHFTLAMDAYDGLLGPSVTLVDGDNVVHDWQASAADNLEMAANAYANVLTARERRKLGKS